MSKLWDLKQDKKDVNKAKSKDISEFGSSSSVTNSYKRLLITEIDTDFKYDTVDALVGEIEKINKDGEAVKTKLDGKASALVSEIDQKIAAEQIFGENELIKLDYVKYHIIEKIMKKQ